MENVNNLLFKSFINPYSADSGEKGQRPVPCRVKLEIQKRIDKLFRYVEIHCRRMCPFLGWEGYNHVRSDDYIDYYQVKFLRVVRTQAISSLKLMTSSSIDFKLT